MSLTHWTFHSVPPEQRFGALLRGLDWEPALLRLPAVEGAGPAARYLKQGYVPFTHRLRRGSKSVSFERCSLECRSCPVPTQDSVAAS
ncbi:hypothetical protein [Myxococcus xanthus]|uniref:Uncharacterized protein n=1 Tax=Myxococcus xanthus TaxID=34 RepID=A0AAE6FY33_MYXXA|nr:hypothetical protein [Myxococcus xanthus]QDE67079.1 hypothetical protein BHS09_08705 [Myxococcus xanthus]QDE74353.1 hypothetical protein BHS08_08715 [Myxococcus xanthus]QDE95938.1 hypothetical protein BHS05_08710 [Myxococcus xanthus]QDF03277.1 hypothetical protein BHS04_08625 [Myxococcus xanthus]